MSASAYYERAKGNRSARAIEDERLLARIREAHERNFRAYGYGQPLMKQAGIHGAKRRGKP